MFIFFEFIFFFIFIFIKLYSILIKKVSFSIIGGRLEKYIKELKSTTCSFNITGIINNFNLKNFFLNLSCWCKQIAFYLLVSTVILILKISLSYNFFVSNVLIIKIINNSFDIAQFLGGKYYLFKVSYYILFYIFVFVLTHRFYLKIISIRNSKEINEENSNANMYDIKIHGVNDNHVIIKEKGLFQNILITGSIGSGKTSSAISNILDQLIQNKIGGLVIDIKGDYINKVKQIAKKYNQEDKVIEISVNNEYKYNPLHDILISSFEMASRIKKVLTLLSKDSNNNEPFWLDKSEEYIRDFITLIRAYNNNFVNFEEIHNLVINKEYISEKIRCIKENVLKNKYSDKELFAINSAIVNIKNDYLNLDLRTFGIIRSEITRMTSVFLSDIHTRNKYCEKSNKINFLSNNIYVLSLDIANNEKISKIIATYIKLDFERQVLKCINKKRPVFLICDEYQEIVNGEDANFFSLSRQYKCINVVSMQSYSSLVNALGNEHTSNVIIQNFVNKIWFRNDDEYTIKKIITQLGKEKVYKKSKSYSENGRNSRYNMLLNKFISYKSDFSESYSETEILENKYGEEYFTQKLNVFEAMCLISDGNKMKLYENFRIKRWEEDNSEYEIK